MLHERDVTIPEYAFQLCGWFTERADPGRLRVVVAVVIAVVLAIAVYRVIDKIINRLSS